jgi:hypothetical protein
MEQVFPLDFADVKAPRQADGSNQEGSSGE